MRDYNVLILAKKNGQQYAFVYDDERIEQLERTLMHFLYRSDLDFMPEDAMACARAVRKLHESKRNGNGRRIVK